MISHEELEKELSKNSEYVKAKAILKPYYDLITYVMDFHDLPKKDRDKIAHYIEKLSYKAVDGS